MYLPPFELKDIGTDTTSHYDCLRSDAKREQ